MDQTQSLPVFVNKILLEHSHAHLLICIVYDCSHCIIGRVE